MLQVKTPEQVLALLQAEFSPLPECVQSVELDTALGRILAEDIVSTEYVPDFDRSTMDGYAVRSADTFGCSEAIPAILPLCGQVLMGQNADFELPPGCCCAVPTGGAIPRGADSVVMLEYCEDYGDGSIGVCKSTAPGMNLVFRGDDVFPGKPLLSAGRRLNARDIGALAALGIAEVPVKRPLRVAVLSTGDELVLPEQKPGPGQVRDVNGPMLRAMLQDAGAEPICFGIVPDQEDKLRAAVEQALSDCDAVLLSGGSSVGERDASCKVIGSLGRLLLHGIAVKPGKPTILGKCGGKPVVGLPGHPVAAYYITRLFVFPLLARLQGRTLHTYPISARLSESVDANHGRAQFCGCRLERGGEGWIAHPIRTKSGLITTLTGTEGFFCIQRDCEGLPAGAEIQVFIDQGD